MKETLGRTLGLQLTRSSTNPVLPVPNTMSYEKLELAACGLSAVGSGGPWRLPGQEPG